MRWCRTEEGNQLPSIITSTQNYIYCKVLPCVIDSILKKNKTFLSLLLFFLRQNKAGMEKVLSFSHDILGRNLGFSYLILGSIFQLGPVQDGIFYAEMLFKNILT